MKLYRVETEISDYDSYDSIIIAANDFKELLDIIEVDDECYNIICENIDIPKNEIGLLKRYPIKFEKCRKVHIYEIQLNNNAPKVISASFCYA